MGALFGAFAALCIGMSDLFGRHVVNRRGPILAAIVVQAVGVVVSAITLTVVASEWVGADVVVGFASGIGLGVGLWSYLTGLTVSSSAVVGPVVATLSAVIPFAYAITRGASTSEWAIVGAVVAIGGLVLVSMGGGPLANIATGLRWSIISGLGYGFGLSIIIEAGEASGAWPAVSQRFGALVLMLVVAVGSKAGFELIGVRLAGVAAGVFAALSTVFYLLGVQADATPAVVTASMFPAATVVIGRFAYHDVVTRLQVFGLGIVLVGIAGVVAL